MEPVRASLLQQYNDEQPGVHKRLQWVVKSKTEVFFNRNCKKHLSLKMSYLGHRIYNLFCMLLMLHLTLGAATFLLIPQEIIIIIPPQ